MYQLLKKDPETDCIVNHNNFRECFTFLDCAMSSLGNRSVFELNWCYDEFSSLLCDVTTTTCDDNHIMQSFKNTSLHQAMKGIRACVVKLLLRLQCTRVVKS